MKNGLPTFDDKKVFVLGNGNYDFTLGFRNAFSYKNLSMSVLVDMKFGADVYSMSKMQSHVNGTSKETLEGREGWYASEQAPPVGQRGLPREHDFCKDQTAIIKRHMGYIEQGGNKRLWNNQYG